MLTARVSSPQREFSSHPAERRFCSSAPAGPLYPPLAQSTPPPSPVQPSPPSDPNPPIATPTSPFDRYPYKPPQHTRFASPGPPLGSTPNDCAVVLRLPNFAWINHRDVDPDTRRERRPARDLGKNLKLHWMSGTEVERRVVEGVHRRVDSLGASQSMRAKARVARFARDAANADAKARGEQRPTKADQDKQAERAGQLGWGNLWLGDHRLRGAACQGKSSRNSCSRIAPMSLSCRQSGRVVL